MTNPNPTRISEPMWAFWLAFSALEPTARLGGIYAAKPGYHNFRDALPVSDYSVQLDLDGQGPGDMAAAIDLTFPDAQGGDYATIARYSARLLASGRDPDDERGRYLREFYGNADDDREVEGWDFQAVEPATSDDSHLWHIHLSFIRAYLNDPAAFAAVLSILKGESVAAWRAAPITKGTHMLIRSGAGDGSIYYVPGGLTSSGKVAAYAVYPPILDAFASSGMPTVQLPDGVSVGKTGLFDLSPKPWPVGGGAGPIHLELSGTGTPV